MEASDAAKTLLSQWINTRHQALLEQVMMTWQAGMRGLEPDDILLQDLRKELGHPPEEGVEDLFGAGTDLGEDLGRAVDALESAPSQGEVLKALLDGLQPFVERSAIFVVKQGIANLYASRGFETESPRPGSPVVPPPPLEGLISGRIHVLREIQETYAALLAPLSRFEAGQAMILPLRLRRKAVAVLLVDSGLRQDVQRPAEIRALAHVAEACLSFLAGQKEEERPAAADAGPSARTAQIVPSIQEAAPPLDPKVRATAERLARVLVGDIELYFPQKVTQGQQQGNLYGTLREELDRSRSTFVERFGEDLEVQHKVFLGTIVQLLCGGDPAKLGPAPWAPRG
ncbi:MAG: hypothetical protein HY823_04390 [Acidobacteria bacterium]|nr:hypothetical protein [Acidobacteriota bacterium]